MNNLYVFAEFENPIRPGTLQQLLLSILDIAVYILFPIVVLMIVYTGYLFVSAQGNPTKIETARKALIWTVIGALIILGARALALGIQATVNSIM